MGKSEASERYERYFWEIIFDGWQCHPWNHPTQEGSSFLADVQGVATVGDAQSTFERTHFLLLSPSSGTLSSYRFIQGSTDARQIGLSNHVLWKHLFPNVMHNPAAVSRLKPAWCSVEAMSIGRIWRSLVGAEKTSRASETQIALQTSLFLSSANQVHDLGVSTEVCDRFFSPRKAYSV